MPSAAKANSIRQETAAKRLSLYKTSMTIKTTPTYQNASNAGRCERRSCGGEVACKTVSSRKSGKLKQNNQCTLFKISQADGTKDHILTHSEFFSISLLCEVP